MSTVEEDADGAEERYRPDDVLVFDASATAAHFKRAEGNSASQTYRVPPRTTVAGLVSGIVGHPYDSYYDLFRRSNSAIAVVPRSTLRTQAQAYLHVNTDDQNQHVVNVGPDDAFRIPRTWGDDRKPQREPYALLFDVEYRFVVGIEDDATYSALRQALETRRYEYTPCLGRRECGAAIEYRGEHAVEHAVETTTLTSALPDSALDGEHGVMLAVQDDGQVIDTERSPAEQKADGLDDPGRSSTRHTIRWETWTVPRDGGNLRLSRPIEAARIALDDGDETVAFA